MTPGALGHWLWIAVIALTPVQRLITMSLGTRVTHLVLLLLAACLAARRVERPYWPYAWIGASILCIFAGVLTGYQAADPTESLYTALRFAALTGITPFVLAYYAQRRPDFLPCSVTAFCGVQTASATAGLLQQGGVAVFGEVARQGRSNGLAGHPNVLGLMSSIAALALIFVLIRGRYRSKALCLIAILLNFAAIVAAGSLSSLIAFFMGLAALLLATRSSLRAIILASLVATASYPTGLLLGVEFSSVTVTLSERIDSVTGQGANATGSLIDRTETYDFAVTSIKQHLWTGVGLDGANAGTFDGETAVHNLLLRMWYEGGVALACVALLLIALTIHVLTRSLKYGWHPLPAALIFTIVAWATGSAFLNQYQYWLPLLWAVSALHDTGGRPHPLRPLRSQTRPTRKDCRQG